MGAGSSLDFFVQRSDCLCGGRSRGAVQARQCDLGFDILRDSSRFVGVSSAGPDGYAICSGETFPCIVKIFVVLRPALIITPTHQHLFHDNQLSQRIHISVSRILIVHVFRIEP
jgi:hypothetical protein